MIRFVVGSVTIFNNLPIGSILYQFFTLDLINPRNIIKLKKYVYLTKNTKINYPPNALNLAISHRPQVTGGIFVIVKLLDSRVDFVGLVGKIDE